MPAARSASSDSDDGSVSPAIGLTSSRLVRARLSTSPAATAAMAINPTPNVRIGPSSWLFRLVPLNQRCVGKGAESMPIAALEKIYAAAP